MSRISDLSFPCKKLETEKRIKSSVGNREETNIRVEISGGKTIEKISEVKLVL